METTLTFIQKYMKNSYGLQNPLGFPDLNDYNTNKKMMDDIPDPSVWA